MKLLLSLILFLAVRGAAVAGLGDSVVVINEVHYHPVEVSETTEFIELYNQLAVDVDMSGWKLDGGVSYLFPEGTVIPRRGYLVVAKDPAALQASTGFSGALGPFEGVLSNGGETLRLYNNNGALRTRPESVGQPVENTLAEWRMGEDDPGAGSEVPGNATTTGTNGGWALTKNGAPVYSETTPAGSTVSMHFTGTDNYSAASQITATDNIGMECWVHPTALGPGGFSFVLSNGRVGNGGYAILEIGGKWRIIHNGVAASGAGPDVQLNTWTHLRFLRQGGISNLFVDGVDAGIPLSGTPSTPDFFHIGANSVASDFEGAFNGRIDAVRIFEFGGSPPLDGSGNFNPSLDRRRVMDELAYKDDGAWPIAPDGSGFSLAKIDPQSGGHVSNWAWSLAKDGSPGVANFPAPPAVWDASLPTVSFNETSGANAAVFHVELFNHGNSSVNLTGWEIVDAETASSYPLTGSLAPGAFLDLDETALGFEPADNDRLFLYTPARAQVTDALRIAKKPRAREIDGTGRWMEPLVTSFGSANSVSLNTDIVINEIFYEPFDNGSEQWIELKNRGAAAVDLTSWSLSEAVSYTFPPGSNIGAGQVLVVARNSAALLAKYTGRPIIGDWSGSLSDDGERIVLEDALGNPVDEVDYGTRIRWPEHADRGGSSLELRDARSDNAQAEAWAASDREALGTWQTVSYTAVATDDGLGNDAFRDFLLGMLDAGEILLDDVSVRESPTGSNIEFIQNGDFEGDAVGSVPSAWRCIGNHGHGRSVVVVDPDDAGNQCLHVIATANTEDKHNRIETTFDNNQAVVVGRTYQISFRARWMGGSNQVNTRLYFNYLQRTNLLNVGDAWGTPGLENSVAVANAGPTASALSHAPTVPPSNAPVTISAQLNDPDGIASAQLFYRANSGSWASVPMSLNADGFHVGTVPGRSSSTIVQFYIRSTDGLGAVADFPSAGEGGGCFYKVNDNNADNTGLRTNFRVIISPEHASRLFQSTERMSNDPVPCTVIEHERIVYYQATVRLHGSASGRYGGAVGYHITFNDDQKFRGVHSTVNIDHHPAFREVLAKHMLNRAGGAYWSHYDEYAKVIGPSVNGIALIAMARTSRQFTTGLFPENGTGTLFNHELLYQPNGTVGGNPEGLKINNPYNHIRGSYDLADRGPDKETYRWGWQIRSKRRGDDYSTIVRFNRAFALNGAAFEEEIESVIDVDQFMRTWAMMAINGNDDQFGRLYEHNWRLYERPTDGKLIALPWDLDRAFRLSTSSQLTPTNDEIQRLFEVPKWKRLFDSHLLDIANTTANSEYLDSWATHLGTAVGVNLASYANYAENRGNFALTQMPPEIPFEITTNGGVDFSTADSSISLAGKAWVDVYYIYRDGVAIPLPITWVDDETWNIDLPISPGPNVISLVGQDQRFVGQGTDTITITGTGMVVPADASNLVVSELHYHPADPSAAEIGAGFASDRDFEFFELQNISATNTVDLTSAIVDTGITYAFDPGTQIAAGERLVVPRRAGAFSLRSPGVATATEYYIDTDPTGNQFSNGGESFTLLAADGEVIKSFTYDDKSPWPVAPDGSGPSLVLISPLTNPDHDDPLNWGSSPSVNGSPGAGDGTAFTGDPNADADANGVSDAIDFVIAAGSQPSASFAADGKLMLTVERDTLAQAEIVIETSTDLTEARWQPALGADVQSRTTVSGSLERLIYEIPIPLGAEGRLFIRLKVILP